MATRIVCNGAERKLLTFADLDPAEQRTARRGGNYFRYRGRLYDTARMKQVEELPDAPEGWHKFMARDKHGGVIVKLAGPNVIIGSYYNG